MVEHLAIGVDAEIYDFGLVNRMCGAFLIGMYCRFKPYIEKGRDEKQNPNFFCEFEILKKRIQMARSLHSPGDKLQH